MSTVAPGWNPVPVSDVIVTGQPRLPEVGLLVERTGTGLLTVNPFIRVPYWASGFVTTTFH